MADEKSLKELQDELASKQEELQNLRAERQQAEQDATDSIQAEALKAEIAKVDRDLDAERAQLDIQNNLDPRQVGAGYVPEDQRPDELAHPDTPEGSDPTPATGEAVRTTTNQAQEDNV